MHLLKKVSTTFAITSIIALYGCTEALPPEKDNARIESKEEHNQQILQPNDGTVLADIAGNKGTPPRTAEARAKKMMGMVAMESEAPLHAYPAAPIYSDHVVIPPQGLNTESYQVLKENGFIATTNDPLSTFSIDVDTASYANIRRFINGGSLPPSGAVRIEEMINYFTYDYPQPDSSPIALAAELGPAPWNPEHQVVKIGVQAKELQTEKIPPSNLVFLVDVSGSMRAENKLPLLQKSLLMLTETLTSADRLAIVAYAGSDRVILSPTKGSEKEKIRAAIMSMHSGGSTHASSGITTAYSLAEQNFLGTANNRVILASDGDFNVGVTDRGELKQLIEEKRESGIYLTVLGFGMGNYHDDTMEMLADSGNGNYAYIDSLLEAKKVLVKERAATLYALANDVKIQVEFNPAKVGAYRLIGYENRMLADEDFKDDTKDAGEIGVGHRVTALYELIPPAGKDIPDVDPLKYQPRTVSTNDNDELMTVKLRFKPRGKKNSEAIELPVEAGVPVLDRTSEDFRFASAVAAFGMKLSGSTHLGQFRFDEIINLAKSGRGADEEGYRAEFIQLVEKAQLLDQ